MGENKNSAIIHFMTLVFVISIMFFMISPACATQWNISPSQPVVGDVLTIEGETLDNDPAMLVSFEKQVPVSSGGYQLMLEDVEIPDGANTYTVKAEGVEDLNVRVKMLIWLTKSTDASQGIATISQSNIPSGTYRIRIDGMALQDRDSVNLMITATQKLETDQKGYFSYNYNTSSIPPGNFIVDIGGNSEIVTLYATKPSFDPLSYDYNSNGSIEKEEVMESIKDYFSDSISKEDVIEVIKVYFSS